MCHDDEVVRSVAGSAARRLTARRLTARRSWSQSAARYRAARAARAAIVPRTTTRPSAAPEKQGDDRSGLAAGKIRRHTGDMGRIIGAILGGILAVWLAVTAAGGIVATLKTFVIVGLIAMAVFVVVWLVARRPGRG